MQSPQVSAKSIQPPWIGIFPVRTPVASHPHHQQLPSPPLLPEPVLAGSCSSQLLFAENDHQQHQAPTAVPPLPANHPRPILYVVMQEVTVGDVIVDGSTESEKLKMEYNTNPAAKSNNSLAVDKHFDISLLKLDHISFADSTSKTRTNKRVEEESPYDMVARLLERNRKQEGGCDDEGGDNKDKNDSPDEMLMPVTILWRGRTSLSKMCPVDIQQALNASSNNPTTAPSPTTSSSSSPQLGFLRAYGALVEEILMNRSTNHKDDSSTKTSTSKTASTPSTSKAEPFADSVAQRVVADTQSLAAQLRHACKNHQPASASGGNSNVIDALFHVKAEEAENVDGFNNLQDANATAVGEEADGFLGFLRNHGIYTPITNGAQSPHIDPLTTLPKHAYGLVRNASRSTGTTPIVKQLSDQDNNNNNHDSNKATIKRSDSGGGGSFTNGVGGETTVATDAVMAMRRHRYMFLKNSLGLVGGNGGAESTRPSLLFTVSPEDTLHTPLSHQQAYGLPVTSMLPSVVTLEVRIATLSGGDFSGNRSSSSADGDGPRSYLPFANVHCFLDPSHRNQIDQMSPSSTTTMKASASSSSSSITTTRHPLSGFLNMLCGSFLHHNQLSEEVLPSLLATQHALISRCYLPLATSALTREAELLATFETILNAKKTKIRELVDDGLRAQRRADDMEALVMRLQERNNALEQQLRNGGAPPKNGNDNDGDGDAIDEDGASSQRGSDDEHVMEVAPAQLLIAQPVATLTTGKSQQLYHDTRQLQRVNSSSPVADSDISAVQGGGGLLLAATTPAAPARKASTSLSVTSKVVTGEKRVRHVNDDDWIPDILHQPPSATTTTTTNHPPTEQEEDDLLALLN